MTDWTNADAATRAVNDPFTPAADLSAIAQVHPALRPAVAAHPNAYPGLLDWLAQFGDPATQAAIAARRPFNPWAPSAASSPSSAFGQCQPAYQPTGYEPPTGAQGYAAMPGAAYGNVQPQRHTGRIVAVIVVSVVVMVALIVGVAFALHTTAQSSAKSVTCNTWLNMGSTDSRNFLSDLMKAHNLDPSDALVKAEVGLYAGLGCIAHPAATVDSVVDWTKI